MHIRTLYLYLCTLMAIFICGACDKSDEMPSMLTLQSVTLLPSVLDEASGLLNLPNGNLLAINDKGPYLYEFNFQGELVKTIEVKFASNQDWEDLAQDSENNIFISDTGNNSNDREDLKLYKVSWSDYLSASVEVEAEGMEFSYDNQTAFPPPFEELNFDCEALVIVNDTPCLFTRDRTMPFRGTTKYYHVLGDQAVFQSSYVTDDSRSIGAITGADLSPSKNKLALISNRQMWIISSFSGMNFFSGNIDIQLFEQDLQIEGVAFQDECQVLLVDEKNGATGGNLYRVNICN